MSDRERERKREKEKKKVNTTYAYTNTHHIEHGHKVTGRITEFLQIDNHKTSYVLVVSSSISFFFIAYQG